MSAPSSPAAVAVATRRLSKRYHRQSLAIAMATTAGSALAFAGLVLGLVTLWQAWNLGAGNFLIRGTAILLLSALLAAGVRTLRSVRADEGVGTAPGLIERSLVRTVRSIRVVRLGLAACGAAAVLGLAGTAIRYLEGHPPALSPLVDLAVLALCAGGLLRWGFGPRAELDALVELRSAVRED